jgi:hypothetical protein
VIQLGRLNLWTWGCRSYARKAPRVETWPLSFTTGDGRQGWCQNVALRLFGRLWGLSVGMVEEGEKQT